jgi:hypothetical protein
VSSQPRSVAARPQGSSSIATSRAADGWAAWERHATRSRPCWSHSRTWPGQGHGSTASSGQRRPQPEHHAAPALELRRWPRSTGQPATAARTAPPGRPSPSRPPALPIHHGVTRNGPVRRMPRESSPMTPKQPAPPTGSGGIGQKAEPEETSVESTHLATIGGGVSARRTCLPWSQVGGVRSPFVRARCRTR